MTATAVAIVAGLAAAVAAVWPYMPSFQSAPLSPGCRAAWVNRLFLLVDAADNAGEAQVADNARSLISALVVPQEAAKRAR
jgi:hypothetical protein